MGAISNPQMLKKIVGVEKYVVLPYTSQHRGQSNRCFRCASCWSSFLLVELARWSGAGEHGAGGYKNLGGWDTAYRRLALMTSARRCVLFSLYTISTLLSMFLIYLSAFHCQFVAVNGCTPLEKQNQFTQRVENSYLNNYNFLEMPNAVFCSLLAGVACVIEIHYNFDYTEIEWTQKWTMAALVAGILSCLHASLAFALT
uniref:Uncharacterized protein n=1 Tax=Globodera pallida TaxID=36090 RepID=A0A183BKT4_GLOPA